MGSKVELCTFTVYLEKLQGCVTRALMLCMYACWNHTDLLGLGHKLRWHLNVRLQQTFKRSLPARMHNNYPRDIPQGWATEGNQWRSWTLVHPTLLTTPPSTAAGTMSVHVCQAVFVDCLLHTLLCKFQCSNRSGGSRGVPAPIGPRPPFWIVLWPYFNLKIAKFSCSNYPPWSGRI